MAPPEPNPKYGQRQEDVEIDEVNHPESRKSKSAPRDTRAEDLEEEPGHDGEQVTCFTLLAPGLVRFYSEQSQHDEATQEGDPNVCDLDKGEGHQAKLADYIQ